MIFYTSTPDYYNDYIAHFGILGMKWGKKNGPPYPLGSSISTGRRLKNNGSIKKKKRDRHERAANASARDAADLRAHGYIKEADAVQKVADQQRAKSKTAKLPSGVKTINQGPKYATPSSRTAPNPNYNKRKENVEKMDKLFQEGDIDGRRKLTHELLYKDKEILPKMEEAHETLLSLQNISKETIDEGSPYCDKAWKEYSKKYGNDEYGFYHYEWRKGNPYYDKALKEYKTKSKDLELKYNNMLDDIANTLVSDKDNKSVKWDNGVQYTYRQMISGEADQAIRFYHDDYKKGYTKIRRYN